ncbi:MULTISPECIES: hypothetical protein [Streptomyces]|uniref:DUF8175 domain-containing protein n=1 Tax=Streptomyces scabiei (strain 87.22) TaxID=680198 RepID=C9YXS7_STRSW|nr:MULTISPECIES: hypothetical protein [Streptomyces]MBP5861854.1 hypothetical protein [Streptomyces sp. LBUM 1484]KFG09748.1 hypothetical protein IQ61_06605 [Streptomyces scabiei]MBP5877691.1 hypothetical protein [Streptomyces sp. LBUM 1477]MBP5885527.1 hypothetical protein [Streptomyces sp. LBUM 1487]MBP5891644.1 hypothetical protein [Streptomyces sp. LBUM 1481]
MLNSGRAHGGSGEWEQPFWQQRGWILSAGFLVVLLVLAVLFAVTGDGGQGPAGASGDPDPAPTSASPPGGKSGSKKGGSDTRPAGCRTDDRDQAKPTEAPGDFRWKANGTGLVPVSKAAGPLKYDGPVWSCFAHTPMGAVMAAHSITDHLSYDGWRKVVRQQVVPGAGRDALVASRSQEADKSTTGSPDAGGYAGFTVLSYDETRATVMVLVRGMGDGGFGSASVTMRWQDGDWKLSPDPDGTVYSGVSQVSGTDGFVTWEA